MEFAASRSFVGGYRLPVTAVGGYLHAITADGGCTLTLLLISIFLQFPVFSEAALEDTARRKTVSPAKNRQDASSTTSSSQEPSDSDIFEAIVQSMQSYYARQAAKNRTGVGGHGQGRKRRRRRDEEVACYEDLGCFRDEGPFDYLDMLPLAPERIQTRFLLETRRSIAAGAATVALHYANVTSMYTGVFNRSNPTKMMIHGFGSSCQKVWATEMRTALLQADDVNVICVDWEAGAELPNYVQAAANARLVGKQVARLIRGLNALRGTNNTSFHLIGFSLGAHVAGFAGDELRNISRITGLDPAAPLFESYSPKVRLDPSDANFVDVIHSNGESLLYGGLGAFDTMGHVDFYPNGGKVQAGCSNIFVGAISDLIWYQSRSSDGRSLCNHRRAYKFFTDSVLPTCMFPAFACDDYEKFLRGDCFDCGSSGRNCGMMGYYADIFSSRGKFYLLTRDSEPFCANQFKVVVESSPGLTPTYGSLEVTLISWNQVNETFQLSSEWEQLVPGQPLSRIIVAHPSLSHLISAQIKYTPYKGWITNGLEHWAVDRLTLVDSFQKKYSFCRRGLPLAEGKPTTMFLRNEDCMELGSSEQSAIATHKIPINVPLSPSSVIIDTALALANSIADVLPNDDNYIMHSVKPLVGQVNPKKRADIIDSDKKETIYMKDTMSLSSSSSNETKIAVDMEPTPNNLNKMYFRFVTPSWNMSTPLKAVQRVAFRQKFVDIGPNSLSGKKPNPMYGRRYGSSRPRSMRLPSGAAGIVRILSPTSNRIGRKLPIGGEPPIDGQMVFMPNGPPLPHRGRYIQIHPFSNMDHMNRSRPFMVPISSSRMLQAPPPPPHHRAMKMLTATAGRRLDSAYSSPVPLPSVLPQLDSQLPPSNPPLPPPSPR